MIGSKIAFHRSLTSRQSTVLSLIQCACIQPRFQTSTFLSFFRDGKMPTAQWRLSVVSNGVHSGVLFNYPTEDCGGYSGASYLRCNRHNNIIIIETTHSDVLSHCWRAVLWVLKPDLRVWFADWSSAFEWGFGSKVSNASYEEKSGVRSFVQRRHVQSDLAFRSSYSLWSNWANHHSKS